MKDILEKDIQLGKIVPLIDWTLFFFFWNFKAAKFPAVLENAEAKKVYDDALDMLRERANEFEVSCVLEFFNAAATDDDVIVLRNGCEGSNNAEYRLPMLRQQTAGSEFLSLVDFVDSDWDKVGLFCVKAQAVKGGDEYEDLLKDALCARLVDACGTWLEKQTEAEILSENAGNLHTGCSCIACANLTTSKIIRPAFGYPASPDHSLKKDVVDILQAGEKIGVEITESYSMIPSTSAAGMLMIHPKAHYFGIGKIGKDQWEDYRRRRGFTEGAMQKLLPFKF
jgi:5-methyltetrahydrofolate--homocysteine methyltransferase